MRERSSPTPLLTGATISMNGSSTSWSVRATWMPTRSSDEMIWASSVRREMQMMSLTAWLEVVKSISCGVTSTLSSSLPARKRYVLVVGSRCLMLIGSVLHLVYLRMMRWSYPRTSSRVSICPRMALSWIFMKSEPCHYIVLWHRFSFAKFLRCSFHNDTLFFFLSLHISSQVCLASLPKSTCRFSQLSQETIFAQEPTEYLSPMQF